MTETLNAELRIVGAPICVSVLDGVRRRLLDICQRRQPHVASLEELTNR